MASVHKAAHFFDEDNALPRPCRPYLRLLSVCVFFAGVGVSCGSVFPALQLGRKRLRKSSKDASGTYLTGLFSQGDKKVRMDGGSARDLCVRLGVCMCVWGCSYKS